MLKIHTQKPLPIKRKVLIATYAIQKNTHEVAEKIQRGLHEPLPNF